MSARGPRAAARTLCACALLLGLGLGAADVGAGEPYVIAGRVLDDAGRPVAAYALQAQVPRTAPHALRWPPRVAMTDAEGGFEIEVPVEGTYTLHGEESATHAGFYGFSAAENTLDAVVRVIRMRRVEGVLHDAEGRALRDADVTVRSDAPGPAPTPTRPPHANQREVRWTRTDADGRFVVDRYPWEGTIEIRWALPEDRRGDLLAGALRGVSVDAGPFDLTAEAGQVVAGEVVDAATGTPVAGARLSGSALRTRNARAPRGPAEAVTDKRGRFVLRPFEPGSKVHVSVRGPDEAVPGWFGTSLREVPAGTVDLRVELQRGWMVEGEVVGVPPADLRGAVVEAWSHRSVVARHALDGTDRRFRLHPLRGPDVELDLGQWPERRLVVDRRAVHEDDRRVRLHVARAHTLRGRVRSRVEGHRVELEFTDAWGRRRTLHGVAEDGTFGIPDVPPGSGFLLVSACGGARAAAVDDADPAAGAVEVRLRAARRILGRIAGLPGPARQVRVVARRGPLERHGSVDPDGGFEIGPLAAGRWAVEVRCEDPAGETEIAREVEAGDEDVVVHWRARR